MTDTTDHPGDLLDILAADHLPSRQTDREHIEAAIKASAAEHGGKVHCSWVREHLTRDVAPHMIGAVMSANRRNFEVTGEWLPNGGPSGNGAKPSRVWRLKEDS